MSAIGELLRPSEAAVVAGVDLRTVNRVIDEKLLPTRLLVSSNGREIWAGACALISFHGAVADLLTPKLRQAIVSDLADHLAPLAATELSTLIGQRWLEVRLGPVTVNFDGYVRAAIEGMERLKAAREIVVNDQDILSGTLVIRGTRIPVHDVAAAVAAGTPLERVLEAYPSLTIEQIELACIYAKGNPLRGRPRQGSNIPPGATVISSRVVPRRRQG